MLQRLIPALLAAAVISLSFGPGSTAALAESPGESVRVRGSIESFDGGTLAVKTREGPTVNIVLAPGWTVSSVARAGIADIKLGDYVGIASLPTENGGDGALEVLIFPSSLKGAGEGSFGWDLKPNSTMTNATVADAVKDVNGQTVTVSYHGKEKKIVIPTGTPAVTLASATKADLKPGVVVFVSAEKNAAGVITAHQFVVGSNGVVPPM